MGIYFIADPDGYWLEIVPAKEMTRHACGAGRYAPKSSG